MSEKLTIGDVEKIMSLLDASSFDEVKIETDGFKLSLRRAGAADDEPAPTPRTEPAPAAKAVAAPAQDDLIDFPAPMLGVFYRSPKPGASPFVEVGSALAPDTVVGIVEVMKLMNSLATGLTGEVAEILVADGTMVEFGQTLLRVRRR